MIAHVMPLTYCILFAVALVASVFDTLVGGGGLITLPSLLILGLPPHVALGTNKFQSTFGSGSASLHLIVRERSSIKQMGVGIAFTAIGAMLGVVSVMHISADFLQKTIPPILLLVLLYAIFSKRFRSAEATTARMPYLLFMLLFGLLFGWYDAFLGPGVGTLWAATIVGLLGFSLRSATIYAKILNFTSNVVALSLFIVAHQVIYTLALSMAIGQFMGGQIGGHLIVKKGHYLIRPVFISIVSILFVVLTYKIYFGVVRV